MRWSVIVSQTLHSTKAISRLFFSFKKTGDRVFRHTSAQMLILCSSPEKFYLLNTRFLFVSGRWVFGQLHPEHFVCPVPSLQCHCCHRPVAALQRGGEAISWRRPPLPHRLLASCQEDPADHPKRNLRECLINMVSEIKFRKLKMSVFLWGCNLVLKRHCVCNAKNNIVRKQGFKKRNQINFTVRAEIKKPEDKTVKSSAECK